MKPPFRPEIMPSLKTFLLKMLMVQRLMLRWLMPSATHQANGQKKEIMKIYVGSDLKEVKGKNKNRDFLFPFLYRL